MSYRIMMKLWNHATATETHRANLTCEDCGGPCDDNADENPVPPPIGARHGTDLCASCYRERRRGFDSPHE